MLNSKIDNKNIELLKNLSRLREELDVYWLIASNASNINKNGVGKFFFGFLQRSCIDLIALNICKIFEDEQQDRQGKVKYELNSIEGVLRCIVNEQPSVLDSSLIDKFAQKYGHSPNEGESLSTLSSTVAEFRKKYQKELDRFKTFRDKRAAHSELGFNPDSLPSYDIMECLFNFASELYMLVSAAFVSTASISVVPYDLNSHSKVKVGLKRILRKLGVEEK